jgi:hypothetical protein
MNKEIKNKFILFLSIIFTLLLLGSLIFATCSLLQSNDNKLVTRSSVTSKRLTPTTDLISPNYDKVFIKNKETGQYIDYVFKPTSNLYNNENHSYNYFNIIPSDIDISNYGIYATAEDKYKKIVNATTSNNRCLYSKVKNENYDYEDIYDWYSIFESEWGNYYCKYWGWNMNEMDYDNNYLDNSTDTDKCLNSTKDTKGMSNCEYDSPHLFIPLWGQPDVYLIQNTSKLCLQQDTSTSIDLVECNENDSTQHWVLEDYKQLTGCTISYMDACSGLYYIRGFEHGFPTHQKENSGNTDGTVKNKLLYWRLESNNVIKLSTIGDDRSKFYFKVIDGITYIYSNNNNNSVYNNNNVLMGDNNGVGGFFLNKDTNGRFELSFKTSNIMKYVYINNYPNNDGRTLRVTEKDYKVNKFFLQKVTN